jgi:hypothetical protein
MSGTAGERQDECRATTDTFCDALRYNACPERVDGRWRGACPENSDTNLATYEECDGGIVRFESQVGFENDATLVYDSQGKLLYGDSSDWDGRSCQVGSPRALTGCVLCYVCLYDPDDEAAGGGGQGGEGGGTSFCSTSPDGFISLP